jgi:hypothetical protein
VFVPQKPLATLQSFVVPCLPYFHHQEKRLAPLLVFSFLELFVPSFCAGVKSNACALSVPSNHKTSFTVGGPSRMIQMLESIFPRIKSLLFFRCSCSCVFHVQLLDVTPYRGAGRVSDVKCRRRDDVGDVQCRSYDGDKTYNRGTHDKIEEEEKEFQEEMARV